MATELEDLQILKQAEDIADNIWDEVKKWDNFSRDVIGKQITRMQSEKYARRLTQLARPLNRFAQSLKFQKKNEQRTIKELKPDYFIDEQGDIFSIVDLDWLTQSESTSISNLQSPISNLYQGINHD